MRRYVRYVPAVVSAARAKPRRPFPRAFSLAELTMTLMILAIVATIAVPRVNNTLRRSRLDMASRRLMADLQLVRSQAIRDRVDCAVLLYPAQNKYILSQNAANATARTVEFNVPPYEDVRMVQTSMGASVTFNRLGLPNAGGTITLEAGIERAVITISATTGRATRTVGP